MKTSLLLILGVFAVIVVPIPDTDYSNTIDAMSYLYGYQDTVQDAGGKAMPNPVTKEQFVGKTMTQFIQQSVGTYNANIAADKRRKEVIAETNQNYLKWEPAVITPPAVTTAPAAPADALAIK